jgi:hypothetical protein
MHTKSPWKYDKYRAPNGGTYYRIRTIDAQADDFLAQVGPWQGRRDGLEAEANARLIATAPKLVDCLYSALKTLRCYSSYSTNSAQNREIVNVLANALGVHENEI